MLFCGLPSGKGFTQRCMYCIHSWMMHERNENECGKTAFLLDWTGAMNEYLFSPGLIFYSHACMPLHMHTCMLPLCVIHEKWKWVVEKAFFLGWTRSMNERAWLIPLPVCCLVLLPVLQRYQTKSNKNKVMQCAHYLSIAMTMWNPTVLVHVLLYNSSTRATTCYSLPATRITLLYSHNGYIYQTDTRL